MLTGQNKKRPLHGRMLNASPLGQYLAVALIGSWSRTTIKKARKGGGSFRKKERHRLRLLSLHFVISSGRRRRIVKNKSDSGLDACATSSFLSAFFVPLLL